MIHPLPPIRLTGAEVLRDGRLQRRSIALAEGRLTRGPLPEVNLEGFFVLPGAIDLCPGGPDPALTDAATAAAGITTSCLMLNWTWPQGPDTAEALDIGLRAAARHRLSMRGDLRLHLAVEMHLLDDTDRLIETVRRNRIGLVTFTDGLDAALVSPDPVPPDQDRARQAMAARRRELPRHLCALAEAFDEMGVLYGTRADPDGEIRERHAMIGARLALFPADRRAAVAARAMLCPVVLNAASLLKGGADLAHAGEGLASALASDGHPQALAQAAFALADSGRMSLGQAWDLVSAGPAAILRLADRGRIEPGLRADLAVVNAATRRCEATIVRGRLVHAEGEASARFARLLPLHRHAAE